MSDTETAWLAGLLEGEGSFMKGPPSAPNRPLISIEMTDQDIIARVAVMFGVKYVKITNKRDRKWKPSYAARIRGKKAAEMMSRLRPFMGSRRQSQIDVAIASYVPMRPGDNTRKLSSKDVRSIRSALEAGESTLQVAKDFRVSRMTVRKIRDGKSWKSVA